MKNRQLTTSWTIALVLILSGCNLAATQTVPTTPLVITMESSVVEVTSVSSATPSSAPTQESSGLGILPTPTIAITQASQPVPTDIPPTRTDVVQPQNSEPQQSAPQSVEPQPPQSAAPQQDALVGDGTDLYLRGEPNQMSNVLSLLNTLAGWLPVGRTDNNQWLQIQLDDGRIGWLPQHAVSLSAEIATLPVTGEAQDFANVFILPPTQQQTPLYDAPNGSVVGQLNPLTPVQVGQRTGDNGWLQIVTRDSVAGWLPNNNYEITFDIANVPVLADSVVEADNPPPSTSAVIGTIRQDAGGLRLRQLPSTDSRILFNMQAGTQLTIQGRTSDSTWVLVAMPEGFVGWTAAQYLDFEGDVAVVQAISNPEPAPLPDIEAPDDTPPVGIVSGGAREIYLRGQEMGNQRNVFTTVGDSLTDTPYFLRHIPNGYNLGDYGYLLPALQFFNVDTGYGNAFARKSHAAQAGWAAASTLELQHTPANCISGETAVECEFRLVKPSVALIMVGTNDAPAFPASTYQANMQRIIDIALQYGVVPVISTLPPRTEFNDRINEYNGVIRSLAATNNIPLWDFHSAVVNLPGGGLNADGIHLSIPPGAPAATMNFTADNLAYGTTMRNLSALQMLNELMQQVLF